MELKNLKTIFLVWNKKKDWWKNMRNDETTVMKPENKMGTVVILSTGYYKSIIMQHLFDEYIFRKLDSCVNSKIQSNLLNF